MLPAALNRKSIQHYLVGAGHSTKSPHHSSHGSSTPHGQSRAHLLLFQREQIGFRGLARLALGHTEGTGAQDLQPEVRVHFFSPAGGQRYLFGLVSLLLEDLEAKGREGADPVGSGGLVGRVATHPCQPRQEGGELGPPPN